MLTSQGWKPGDTLGAENASHASHYTAASASHIRVLLREDGMGLGAKNGRQESDVFGLDMFQGLLGRLNGKSEDILAKEAKHRRDLRLKEVVVKRYGNTTFVSGGDLVGDKIEKTAEEANAAVEAQEEQVKEKELVAVKAKGERSKKRKRTEPDDVVGDEVAESKKEKNFKLVDDEGSSKDTKNSKKEKKRKHETTSGAMTEEGFAPAAADHTIVSPERSERNLKRQRKAERRAAKEARRLEKELKRRKKTKDKTDISEREKNSNSSDSGAPIPPAPAATQKTAAVARGRFYVRARYLQQKRMAISDQQALKEIFMIKTGA